MEGMPRVPMFAPELKAPDKPLSSSFAEKIREFIVVNYQDDPAKYNEAFNEIESMRNVVMRCSADVESICVMKRYYVQLLTMKKRFPMEENDPLAVPFSWVDRTMDLAPSVTYEDINFEMCCVLFNIGAAHAIIAAKETRSDSDSIKNAFMHFQQASWPMQHLREESVCMQYTILDFEPAFLNFYSTCCLAQAQECMLEKSIIDNRKPVVITKIAVKIKELYEKNLEYFKNSNACTADLLSTSKHKSWLRLFSAKYELYTALASFYSGIQAENDEKMGLRMSYFAHALDAINRARKIVEKDSRESLREAVDFARDVIQQKKNVAQRENDFIYHERVIKPEDFELVEGVLMVKPIAFDQYDVSVGGEDLFSSILPTDVLKTVSLYSEEKLKFKRDIFGSVEKKDAELESFLVSLQLDQLHLDEPIESVRLPDELLSSSAAFSSQPDAFPTLINKFNKVMTMASDVEQELLRLTDRVKDVETEELSKDEGFNAIKAKIEELHSHHKIARENNAELQRAVAAHSENLKLLAMPLSQLSKEICGDYVNPMEHAEGKQLQKVLNKVDEMRRQRFHLISTLNADIDADDITKKALSERDYDSKDLFERELAKHKKTTDLINQNMVAQDNIIKALTEANANFAEFRRHIMESNEKRALHSLTLVTAYQVFKDVVEKTDKALQFYKQSLSLVDALSKGVSIIEETEEKRLSEIKRKEADRRAAIESAEALKEFSTFMAPTAPTTVSNNGGGGSMNVMAGKPSRPRLGDYLEYYRSKTRAAEGAEFASGLALMKSPSSLAQQAYPLTVGAFPIQPKQQGPPIASHVSLSPSNQPQPILNPQTPQLLHTQQNLSTMVNQQQQFPQNNVVSLSAHQPLQQQQRPAVLPRMANTMTTADDSFPVFSPHLPPAPSLHQQPLCNNYCSTIGGQGGGQQQQFAPTSLPSATLSSYISQPTQRPVNFFQPQQHNIASGGCYGVEQQFSQFASLPAASVISSPVSGRIVAGTSMMGYNTLLPVASTPQQLSTTVSLNNSIMSPSHQPIAFTPSNSSRMTTLPQQHQQQVSYCPSKSFMYGTVGGGATLVPSTTAFLPSPQQSFAHMNYNVSQNLTTLAVNQCQSTSVTPQQQPPTSVVINLPSHSSTPTPAHLQPLGGLGGVIGGGAKSPWHQNLSSMNPYASSAGTHSTNPANMIYTPQSISGNSGTTNVQPLLAPTSKSYHSFANGVPITACSNNTGVTMNQQGLSAFNSANLINQHNQMSSEYQNVAISGSGAATTIMAPSMSASVIQQQFHTKAASMTVSTTASGNSGVSTVVKPNHCQLSQGYQQVVKPPASTLLDDLDGLLIGNNSPQQSVVSISFMSQQQQTQQLRPAATVLPVARPSPAAQQQRAQQTMENDSDLAIIGVTSLSHPNGADVVTTVSTTHPFGGNGAALCDDDKIGISDTAMTAVVPAVDIKITGSVNDVTVIDSADAKANHNQSTDTKSSLDYCDAMTNGDEVIGVTKHYSSHIEALLDPTQFNLGECDRTRLEKRLMREEFRRNGLNAQLSKPDNSDPLNELDPHFWLTK